jgi:hypothetical protein
VISQASLSLYLSPRKSNPQEFLTFAHAVQKPASARLRFRQACHLKPWRPPFKCGSGSCA